MSGIAPWFMIFRGWEFRRRFPAGQSPSGNRGRGYRTTVRPVFRLSAGRALPFLEVAQAAGPMRPLWA